MKLVEKVFFVIKKIPSWLWHHKRITIVLIVVGILGFIFYPRPKPPVATQKVVRTTLVQSISVSGTVNAKKLVNLTFPIGGPIVWIGVKKGQSISAYQTIATLDQRTAQKNLKAALISYSLQRNSFDQTIYNNNGIQNPYAALNYSMQVLLQNNQYNLDQAVNSVELVDLARQQAILSTPIAGIVTRADVETAGPTALAGTTTWTVVDPTSVVFDMDIDQADIGKVEENQKVHIVFDAYPNKTIHEVVKTVDFVSHTTSNGGNAFTVETSLPDNTNYAYRIGMNANADIILSQKENVLTVPLSSIVNDHFVYVQAVNGFRKMPIKIGQQNDTDAEVLEGLPEGSVVALDPQQAQKQEVK